MFKILRSFLIITTVASAASLGTWSFFHEDTVVNNGAGQDPHDAMQYQMATVELGNYTGFPLTFNNIAPGHEYTSGIIQIKYTGTEVGDLYFGAARGNKPAEEAIDDILQVKVERVNSAGNTLSWPIANWVNAPYVFQNWTKLADNLSKDEWSYYKIHIYVKSTADNTYQGNVANNGVILYAVQDGFPAPSDAPAVYVYGITGVTYAP